MSKISPPAWCSDAVPTGRGWAHPRTGELLVSRPHTKGQIHEWHGIISHWNPAPEGSDEMLTEAPSSKSLDSMSKKELEDLGREHGIELDRRQTKMTLIQELRDAGVED